MAKNNEKNKKNNIYCTKNTIDMEKEGIREQIKNRNIHQEAVK